MWRTAEGSIIKKSKDCHREQTGQNQAKISKRVSLKSPEPLKRHSWTTQPSRESHRDALRGCRPGNSPLLHVALRYADSMQILQTAVYFGQIRWKQSFVHRVWRKETGYDPKEHPHSEAQWWQYVLVTLQCLGISSRNDEDRRMCDRSGDDCRLLPSKQDTPLTVSIREANKFLWNHFVFACKVK